MLHKIKLRAAHWLNESARGAIVIACLIVLSIGLIISKTEFSDNHYLRVAIDLIGCIFAIEYVARIWVADITYPDAQRPRLAYILSINGVIDFLAAAPLFIGYFAQNFTAVRALRLLRLAQIFKIKIIRNATMDVFKAFKNCWDELLFTSIISFSFVLIAASLMYLVERNVQPEAFGSIPRAMWWAVATLTTVGYGDVYPVTSSGRVIAAFLAVIGIAAVAMPAGILASAFSEGRQSTALEDK